MILSEAASSQGPCAAAIVAHRMLAKPCNVAELETAIRRSCDLHTLTGEAEAYRQTMAATALPSRPGVYMELNQVLSDPNWQPSHVSAVVERDVAMSAKVLQLANSALFGLTQEVTSVQASGHVPRRRHHPVAGADGRGVRQAGSAHRGRVLD